MKILVVDDDPVQRGVIAKMLEASGNDVIEADCGEAAVAAVQGADTLGLILMDLRMPGIGGEQALIRIRALPGWRGQVPIKAMSARSLTVREQEVFDGFLPKGPDIEALLAATVAEGAAPGGTDKGEHHSFFGWVRTNWQLLAALGGMLSASLGWFHSSTVNDTKAEDRLVVMERAVQKNEERDEDLAVKLTREITEQAKRADSRIQEIFGTLNTAIGEAAKHSDGREMEIFTSLNKDISDVAGRIDAMDRRFTELRHIRDTEQSGMLQRIAVLESQVKFFAEHIDVSTRVPSPASGKRQ